MTYHLHLDADGRQSGQDSSDQTEDATSDCDTLPTYESLENMSSAGTSTPSGTTTGGPEGSDEGSVKQEFSFSCTSDEFDRLGRGWGAIDMRMLPIIDTPKCLETPWGAVLQVKCRDVPRLMREGFFWSTENLLPEQGYMSNEDRPEWTALGCTYRRTWMLADKSTGHTPRWVGRLEVTSPLFELLPGFRVQNLSRDNIYSTGAWNNLGQGIYNYDYRFPNQNYNCIYDDKPLDGWWPWPRKEAIRATFPDVDAGELFPVHSISFSGSCCQPEPHQPHHHGQQQPSSCVIL